MDERVKVGLVESNQLNLTLLWYIAKYTEQRQIRYDEKDKIQNMQHAVQTRTRNAAYNQQQSTVKGMRENGSWS